jgi:signal transduction histidine kinase
MEDRTSFSCRLNLEKDRIYRIFIRVRTSSYLLLPVNIVTSETLQRNTLEKNRYVFWLFGIIFAALVFNLILLVITRDRNYILLCIILLLVFLASLYQYGFELIPSMGPYLKGRMRLLLLGASYLCMFVFVIRYLDLRKFKRLYRLFIGITAFFAIYTLAVLIPSPVHEFLVLITPGIATLSLLITLGTAVYAVQKKQRMAIFLLIYLIVFLAGSVVWTLLLMNIVDYSYFNYHINLIAFSMVSLLLTLGLAEKIRIIKELRISESRLRENNLTRDRFFSIIGHDLMNPVNALNGFAGLMTETISCDDKESSIKYAHIINQLVQRLTNLLQNILLWSKTQSGQFTLNPAPTNISALIEDSVALMMPVAENKGIKVALNVDVNSSALVDYHIISAVIRNLVWNAIKFTGSGGVITIDAHTRTTSSASASRIPGSGSITTDSDNCLR